MGPASELLRAFTFSNFQVEHRRQRVIAHLVVLHGIVLGLRTRVFPWARVVVSTYLEAIGARLRCILSEVVVSPRRTFRSLDNGERLAISAHLAPGNGLTIGVLPAGDVHARGQPRHRGSRCWCDVTGDLHGKVG